jgi:hypothetical protein
MEIFLTKSGYHNDHHVENLASIFFIFTPIWGQIKILVAIWLHDASKKNCWLQRWISSLVGEGHGIGTCCVWLNLKHVL